MNDITPEMVAAVATKLYNSGQSPLARETPLTESVTPPKELPVTDVSSKIRPITPMPTASPMVNQAVILGNIQPSSNTTQLSQPTSSDSESAGLKAFVQKVRTAGIINSPETWSSPPHSSHYNPHGLTHGTANPGNYDVESIRKHFPILKQKINGKPLIWFDNAATTQKPQVVIDSITHFYSCNNSNIHRAAHTLAARATDEYENSRQAVATFLGAASPDEIVFARGTTEAINLVANTYGKQVLNPGDEIVLSRLEHHANIVPWQMIAKERGAVIRVIPVNDRGEIILEEYEALLGSKTKIVSLTHASNSLGTLLPIAEMIAMAKRHGAVVLVDGAQSVAHISVNVRSLDVDFYVFSGHKIFGPTGIGVLYAKMEHLKKMPPYQGGGNMIKNVTFEETTYSEPPAKFEAGTPNIADAVGLRVALEYISRLGLPRVGEYEHQLLEYATHGLLKIPGLRLIGTAAKKVSVISFVIPGIKTEEIGKRLDQEGIAVRTGHHCAQPSLRRFGVESTVRPSFSIYNTNQEIDHLLSVIKQIRAT